MRRGASVHRPAEQDVHADIGRGTLAVMASSTGTELPAPSARGTRARCARHVHPAAVGLEQHPLSAFDVDLDEVDVFPPARRVGDRHARHLGDALVASTRAGHEAIAAEALIGNSQRLAGPVVEGGLEFDALEVGRVAPESLGISWMGLPAAITASGTAAGSTGSRGPRWPRRPRPAETVSQLKSYSRWMNTWAKACRSDMPLRKAMGRSTPATAGSALNPLELEIEPKAPPEPIALRQQEQYIGRKYRHVAHDDAKEGGIERSP